MKIFRRTFLYLLARAAALPSLSHLAMAQAYPTQAYPTQADPTQFYPTQAYPTRPVRIIVGFPAGGNTDIAARIVARWLSERLGQQFIIENRPGAAGSIATETVVRSPADGHTLLAATSGNTINAALHDNIKFNFINDIVMAAGIMRSPLVLEVYPAVPARTVAEFIAYVKANPGKISLASFGINSVSQMTGELFKIAAGLEMVHVPYRGSAPMITALLGGQVMAAFDNLPASIEQIRAGKLRALAITTRTRSEALPEVPTIGEFLQGFEASAWTGIGAPRETPPEIIDRLNREINAGLADPAIRALIADGGGTPFMASTAELAKFVREQAEQWAMIVRAAKIKPE